MITSAADRVDLEPPADTAELVIVGVRASTVALNHPRRRVSPLQPDRTVVVAVLRQTDGEDAITVVEALSRQTGLPVETMSTQAAPKAERIYVGPAGALIVTSGDGLRERLARWFTPEGSTYDVVEQLQEMRLVSQHDGACDPPACLSLDRQDRVMALLQFALRPRSALVLGACEDAGRGGEVLPPTAPEATPDQPLDLDASPRTLAEPPRRQPDSSLACLADHIVERYAPAYVVLNARFEVSKVSARAALFLDPAPGVADVDMVVWCHRDLRADMRAALRASARDQAVATVKHLQMEIEGERRLVDIAVEPIVDGDRPGGFVVLFADAGAAEIGPSQAALTPALAREDHLQRMETEIRLAKARLRAAADELASTDEEPKTSNVQHRSINEELQSANEALETSREALQSVNEELQTVNAELAHRVDELARANSDMRNLLESTQIATIFLDNDLRVKSFTPSVAEIFHLADTDIGRPIGYIDSRIAYGDLQSDVRRVLRTLATVEREVELTAGGARYLARVLPYRSLDNVIAGAVLTFSDITAVTLIAQALRESEARFRTVADLIPDLLWSNDGERRNDWVNQRWIDYTGQSAGEAAGHGWMDAIHPQDRAQSLASFQKAASVAQSLRHENRIRCADGGYRWFLVQSQSLVAAGKVTRWFGAATDIDDFKQAQERQKLLLAELQHRVKNILAVVRSIASRTVESSPDLAEFSSHFMGRLSALARTQSVLARRGADGVELEDLVREELVSHTAREGEQVEISGPRVRLTEKAAEVFTLALHELTTNAVKYGALATAKGRIKVGWRLIDTREGRRLALDWRESGVPLLDSAPSHRGFGRDLLERGLPYDLGAQTGLDFAPGGLRFTLALPLSSRVMELDDLEQERFDRDEGL